MITNLHEIVQEHSNDLEKVTHLNLFFKDYFLKRGLEISPLVPDLIQNILLKKGGVSIKEVLDTYCIHERKLQRIFSDYIGLSPKEYISVVRLHSFLGLINTKPSEKLTKLVFDTGYYDQSHLVKVFKSITGITPSEYAKSSSLAVNLVELE